MPLSAPRTPAEFTAYYRLRHQVLRAPWGEPAGSERAPDDDDATTTHALLTDDQGTVRGVARLHPSGPGQGQIRYMAVDPAFQGRGAGRQLVHYLEQQARAQGLGECILHARESALPFYQRLGYTLVAPSHLLFGQLQHFLMRKNL